MRLLLKIIEIRFKGLLRLRPATTPLRLDCLGVACGLCCQIMGGEVAVFDDDDVDPVQRYLVKRRGGTQTIKGNGCVCTLYEDGLCSRHSNRPKSCREYPWYNVGGVLFYDTGCPGMRLDRDERPNVTDIRPIGQYLDELPRYLRGPVVFILSLW